jgi:hypothetical protein
MQKANPEKIRVTHETLNFPGFWRILWFGKLHKYAGNKFALIKVFLGELKTDPDTGLPTNQLTGRVEQADLPIGEIPRLHINALFENGELLTNYLAFGPSHLIRDALSLNFSSARVIDRFKRDEDGELVIPRGRHISEEDAQGYFVCIQVNDDPFGAIIPCAEIMRFFYCPTSRFANLLLDSRFLEPYVSMFNPADTYLYSDNKTKKNIVHVRLRMRMLDREARFVAYYYANSIAYSRATDILLFAIGGYNTDHERLIRALPPLFEDVSVKCVVDYIPFVSNGRQRILITRLLACPLDVPFDDIEYRRDNDGTPGDPRTKADKEITGFKALTPINDGNTDQREFDDAKVDGSTGSVEQLKSSELTERFPNLIAIKPRKLTRPEDSKTRAAPFRRHVKHGSKVTTNDITAKDTGFHQALLTLAEDVKLFFDKSREETEPPIVENLTDTSIGQAAYMQVISALNQLKKNPNLVSISFPTVIKSPPLKWVDSVPFNVYPRSFDINNEVNKWLFVDDALSKTRMVMVVRLVNRVTDDEGNLLRLRTRYLFEFQHKKDREMGMLVVWNITEDDISDIELKMVLVDCADARYAKITNPNLKLCWRTKRHNPNQRNNKAVPAMTGDDLLEKVFNAMSKDV